MGREAQAVRSRIWFLAVLMVFSQITALAAQEHGTGRQRLVANELDGPLLEVHFLDVGQGDSMYIRTPGKKHYLVDTGTRSARKRIIPYLKYLDVKALDGVLLTHSHLDHIGALYYIADAFPIKRLYYSGQVHPSGHNRKTLQRLQDKKVELKRVRAGDTFELDEGVKVQVLHPGKDWDGDIEDPNNMSVVVRLTYGDIDFLLTGDAEKRSEKAILKTKLELKSEFLKIGHHGSETSSMEDFLDTVDPLYAIISCGEGNKFNHPHATTMEKLRTRDITILRTDQNGTIGVYTNGKRLMIKIKGKDWQPVTLLVRPPVSGAGWLVVHNRGGSYA